MIELSDRARVAIGRTMALITIVLAVGSLIVSATVLSAGQLYDRWIVHNNLIPAVLAVLAWILIRAQPRSRLVWLLIWDALLNVINGVASTATEVVIERLEPATGSLGEPTGAGELSVAEAIAFNLASWLWIPPVALIGTLALLWFPDGRAPTKRWRVVEAMTLFGMMVVSGLVAWQYRPFGDYRYPTAFLADDAHPLMGLALIIGFAILIASVLLSVVSLVVRYRSSRGVARRRLRWIVWGAGTMAALGASALVFDVASGAVNYPVFKAGALLGVIAFVAGYGLAIRREQLFDIDHVLSRTLLIGFLTLFITVVYVAIVFGLGTVIGRTGGGDRGLSLLATVAVAFAFQPARLRLEHLANRLVYGERATPYEVLSDLTGRLTSAESVGGLLDRMAERVAAGTVAESATLWRACESGFETAAVWPPDHEHRVIAELPADSVTITRADTTLGGLSVVKKRGDELSPTEQRLMADLAGSAALVMDKARLDTALAEQARRLFDSRRRQVDAQDEERHRLEHHLNDTTYSQLLQLKEGIDVVAGQATGDGSDAVVQQLNALGDDAQIAADEVQALARGIFPPLLQSEGLVAAIRGLAGDLPLPVTVTGPEESGANCQSHDPSPKIQAALYFSIAEALTNVVKHAEASWASVDIAYSPEVASFVVIDDGRGFNLTGSAGLSTGLTGITDRLEAVGGRLTIESKPGPVTSHEPGRGTTITGTVYLSASNDRPLSASLGA